MKCPLCRKPFVSQGNLNRHRRTVHAQRPSVVTCHVCEKQYRYKSSLATHMRKHKVFECAVCEQAFDSLD